MDRPTEITSAQTISVPVQAAPPPKHISHTSSAHSHVTDEGRFLPGVLLAGRYRIVGLLGKGGMGEVYRATDLTLGQSVALKFLPASAAENNFLLERFHGEVRIARQISHPNVCRVYDIGETEGMPFISMEYVDGEDLASLLPRIGRLPADRAVSTARKICAGLAAAHAKGVIHRDLKPHNIMLDKRGEIVIMDFGLAAIADQLSGPEARNGTPAYMAPEQLKGTEVTSRSDIYALGLVLYEIFTGRKPYDAKTIKDLISLQESAQLTSMTSIAADIDPAVEHVIRRCLDPDPAKRPADALLVSAALPGGDPLAAALAAGETPSPELVAASGKTEGMSMKYAWLCLAIVLGTVIATPMLKQQKQAFMQTPLEFSPDVLKQKARDFAVSFGHTAHPVDTDFGLDQRLSLITYLDRRPAPRDFKTWLASEAPAIGTYRESQDAMIAEPLGHITETNPPLITPGSVKVLVEAGGRLRGFEAIPLDTTAAIAPIPFETVFQAAGFDPSRFGEVPPRTEPTVPTDMLRAWKGPHPAIPGINPQIDIGWWKGRITWVKFTWPWTVTGTAKTNPFIADLQAVVLPLLVAVGLFFAVLFARRNWKQDRADRRGAFVVGLSMFSLNLAAWAAAVHFAPTGAMAHISGNGLADSITAGAVYLVLYLALEPALRLRWPHAIITWNRALAGRWKDPQVGSHIMIGLALGAFLVLFGMVRDLTTVKTEGLDTLGGMYLINGTRFWIAGVLDRAQSALTTGIEIFFVLFGLRQLLRRDWLAALVGGILFSLLQSDLQNSLNWQGELAVYLVILTALTFALVRFGLLVCITAVFAMNTVNGITLGTDWNTWYAPTGLATILLLLLITGIAFRTTLGERELL
jgi:serine/threonine-protein kinase